MGWACITCERERERERETRNSYKILVRILKEGIGIDGRIVSKWILKIKVWGLSIWTGLIWPVIESSGRLL
jgi:hypothetical protein